MTYQVFLDPRVAKFLYRVTETLQTRIKGALRELQNSPETKGERLAASGFWRVRVGDYRAIYEIDRKEKKVVVTAKDVLSRLREYVDTISTQIARLQTFGP